MGTSQTAAKLDNKTIGLVKATIGGQVTCVRSPRLFSEQAAPPVGLCECSLFLMWRTSVAGVFTPLLFFSQFTWALAFVGETALMFLRRSAHLVCEVSQQSELNLRCTLRLLMPCFVSCLCCHVSGSPGERLSRDQR